MSVDDLERLQLELLAEERAQTTETKLAAKATIRGNHE